ncbi:MAG: hypothetical protein C0613_14790 [Desulfobulbaceae bacterium]|nr:MAG: hypothetical protein C0613_14790 [Desulfobulbaceae bacterium]
MGCPFCTPFWASKKEYNINRHPKNNKTLIKKSLDKGSDPLLTFVSFYADFAGSIEMLFCSAFLLRQGGPGFQKNGPDLCLPDTRKGCKGFLVSGQRLSLAGGVLVWEEAKGFVLNFLLLVSR